MVTFTALIYLLSLNCRVKGNLPVALRLIFILSSCYQLVSIDNKTLTFKSICKCRTSDINAKTSIDRYHPYNVAIIAFSQFVVKLATHCAV